MPMMTITREIKMITLTPQKTMNCIQFTPNPTKKMHNSRAKPQKNHPLIVNHLDPDEQQHNDYSPRPLPSPDPRSIHTNQTESNTARKNNQNQ